MGFKSRLTPLVRLRRLDQRSVELLKAHGITSVEELAGEVEAEPEAVRELLGMSKSEVEELQAEVTATGDPDLLESFVDQRGKDYGLGALDPDEPSA
jgi:hypothetical protein